MSGEKADKRGPECDLGAIRWITDGYRVQWCYGTGQHFKV